ncbi:MAG: hypothetical protein J6K75_06340 [Erysipelotrichaceae bacterium]|nr:hypothetical protein [Erysipelotrichaceae bacterium]
MKKLENCLILLFLFLFFSQSQQISQTSAIMLDFWFEQLVPSLFLCIFILQLLSSTSFFSEISKPFRFLCPLLNISTEALGLVFSCLLMGAPSSTLLINQAYKQKQITEKMAHRLLCSISVSTISFLIMTIGALMLKDIHLGIYLWIIQILCAFVCLGCTRSVAVIMSTPLTNTKKHSIRSALFQTGSILFMIGGYLLIFQNLAHFILSFIPESFHQFVFIISEFSYGCKLISESFDTSKAFVLISALCGFNGLCVQFQSLSMSELHISIGKYFCFRCFQSLMSLLMASAVILLLHG